MVQTKALSLTGNSVLDRPELSVSVAVFRDGKVLLAQRMFEPYAGYYSLPGGRVERGETLREAALRELMEEVQIKADIVDFVDHVELCEYDKTGNTLFHAVIAVFLAIWTEGEAQTGAEVSQVLWYDPLLPEAILMTPNLMTVLSKARKMIC